MCTLQNKFKSKDLILKGTNDSLIEFLKLRKEFKLQPASWADSRITLSVNYLRWPKHLQCILLDKEDRVKYADEIEKHNLYLKNNLKKNFF